MKYDGIIFDLDGTLWDSTDAVYDAWVRVIERTPETTHVHTADEQRSVMGLTALKLMAKLFPELPEDRAMEVFADCCKEEQEELLRVGGKSYPGINDTLEKLGKHCPLFIVSNCDKEYINTYFTSMNTKKFFTDWESHGGTGLNKDENIMLVVKRNGLKHPVYVGDTIWDKEASDAAGVPFIHAAYGFGKIEDCEKISCPAELLKLI